ncbi:MAG: MarR family transcriptional regulator [Cellvibrionaceae bacterium]
MRTTKKIIKMIMKKNDNCTPYRIAKLLEVSHQTVSNLINKNTVMSDETALKAASLLEYSQQETDRMLLELQCERVKGTASERTWLHILKDYQAVAAMILVSVFALPPL